MKGGLRMIFSGDHCAKVLSGEKTQTRRLKRGYYEVGGVYAVQPGRGKAAVGHIRMKRIWGQGLYALSSEEVRAEALGPAPPMPSRCASTPEKAALAHFVTTFLRLNKLPPNWGRDPIWAFEFELDLIRGSDKGEGDG